MSSQTNSYKELIVWQKSMALAVEIYKISEYFPKNERYGLTSQIRRAAVSVPSNIAEGQRRFSKKEFVRFLRIAYSSGAEIETQLSIAQQVFTLDSSIYTPSANLLDEIMRMLNVMIRKLEKENQTNFSTNYQLRTTNQRT